MLNLPKDKKYLLACSFGPDSMALFSMLLKENYSFEVAHVNYHLREESTSETEGLRSYCLKNNVTLHIYDVSSDLGKSNLEAKCRKIRYEFFKDLNQNQRFDAVLVAHNQDDLLETYILQKNRKNLVKFYGITENCVLFDNRIIRPLLSFKKSELTQYCIDNKVPFAIDKTNLENVFKRNQIRHSIVEKMNDIERVKLLSEINDGNDKISYIYSKLAKLDLTDINSLLSLTDIELAYALNLLVEAIDQTISLSRLQCEEIRKVMLSNKPNVVLPIKTISFIKEYNKCHFSFNSNIEYSYVLQGPGKLDTPYFYLDFSKNSSNRNVNNTDYPITIRNARSGDMYQIKDYKKQVRRLFIDWKMPISKRSSWPVIVSKSGEIIYIPRYQKDFKPTKDNNLIVK